MMDYLMGWIIVILVAAVVAAVILLARRRAAKGTPPSPIETPAPPAAAQTPPPETVVEAPAAIVEVQAPPAPAQVEAAPETVIETPPPEAVAEPVEATLPVLVPPQPQVVEPPLPTIETLPSPIQPIIPQFLEGMTVTGKLRRFALDRTVLTLGRSPDNDLVITDEFSGAQSVVDRHARIELRDAWVIIEPASPGAPLFVNGQPTGRNILRNGWRVTLGELNLTYRTAGLGTAPLSEPEAEMLESGAQAPRAPLPSELTPLPDGAVLMNRYIVLETHSETPSLNTYVAESIQAVLRCAKCGSDANEPRQKACRNCGASLADNAPYYPHYQIKESLEAGIFDSERQLIGLSHPSALLPRQSFTETPYGSTPRHYIVGPEVPPQLAATLRGPKELPQILEWAQQLAQGMAYLHNNDVSLGPIDLWRIAIDGTQARWVDFSPCEFVADDQKAARFAGEVRALAEVTFYLITGKRKYDESIEISPASVGIVFDRVLGGLEAPTASQFASALQAGLIEVRRPTSVDVRAGRLSDVGQVRQINEDSLLSIEIGQVRRSISEPLGLYAVCDGMGGHSAGDVASALAVQTLARRALAEVMSDGIADGAPPNWEGWLKGALQEANQAVFGQRRASGSDMGTTCVAALVHCDSATIAHAGDSRCYLVNDAGIQMITQDHSLVQRLIQLGQLTPEEARTHPQRSVIYKNLGDKPAVEPDITTRQLEPGDRLLLCSDGLSGMLDDQHMFQIIMSSQHPQEACRRLIAAANEAGGEDNISAIIVELEALT
jgi:serine/threonine protein phosphatase PrpC